MTSLPAADPQSCTRAVVRVSPTRCKVVNGMGGGPLCCPGGSVLTKAITRPREAIPRDTLPPERQGGLRRLGANLDPPPVSVTLPPVARSGLPVGGRS